MATSTPAPPSHTGRVYCGQISNRLWVRLDRYLAGLPPVAPEESAVRIAKELQRV